MQTPDPELDEPRGPHDLGGLPAGNVERTEHVLAPWEKEVDAMRVLLGQRGLLSADELRLGIESLAPEAYARKSYYEKWTASLLRLALTKGLIDADGFEARVASILAERQSGARPLAGSGGRP